MPYGVQGELESQFLRQPVGMGNYRIRMDRGASAPGGEEYELSFGMPALGVPLVYQLGPHLGFPHGPPGPERLRLLHDQLSPDQEPDGLLDLNPAAVGKIVFFIVPFRELRTGGLYAWGYVVKEVSPTSTWVESYARTLFVAGLRF